MPDTLPHVNIDLQEVTTRNDTAQHIVAGFSRPNAHAGRYLAFPGSRAQRRPCTRPPRYSHFPPISSMPGSTGPTSLAAARATIAALPRRRA